MFCCETMVTIVWDRKDGGRYKYCCCGPVIYREGKGPNANEKPDYQRLQEPDDYPYKDAERDPSLRRPDGAPPPYQESEIKNINETASKNDRKLPKNIIKRNPKEHKGGPHDHPKTAENDHEKPPPPQPSPDKHANDSDQSKSHQHANDAQNHDKPQDLMSFKND
ncbi:hypothetical protein Avbf_06437 [Armadillidium vulgare]|nr:hypothetical protein Avbf_06437 [Armadillidium vulgare]